MASSSKRPEHVGPPDLFYDANEARKYTSSSRMIGIQVTMAERAIELLALPDDKPCLLLDLGCGSGLSGEVLTDQGHYWIGLDISEFMLDVALERESEGGLLLADAGHGISFRPGTFDGVVRLVFEFFGVYFSISALQWLCNADKREQKVPRRLYRLFSSLYASLARGSRAVFQFYPENSAQVELITQQAMKAGFTGGLVIDYPNSSKAKKLFLVLFAGGGTMTALPKGLGTEVGNSNEVSCIDRRQRAKAIRGKPPKKSRQWIVDKKERARRQGRDVRPDTKYTGRKRKIKF